MAMYKRSRGVKIQLVVRAGLELGITRFQVRRLIHSAMKFCLDFLQELLMF